MLKDLSVRVLEESEYARAGDLLNREHYLGDCPAGRQMQSLRTHFQENFEDPRRNNRSYPASSLLVFMAMALFAGRDSICAIQRYGNLLTGQQRTWLDFPVKKGTVIRKVPSFRAFHNFLKQIDPEKFAPCLNVWLGSNLGTLPRALAIDGKWVRDRVLSPMALV
jgi:hypothetical protein